MDTAERSRTLAEHILDTIEQWLQSEYFVLLFSSGLVCIVCRQGEEFVLSLSSG